jgi:DNA-binding transcriptional ArsR family regulator
MRTRAPALLPIFRSERFARLLTYLSLHPDAEFMPSELASQLDILPSTLHHELRILTESGLVSERRIGRERLVRLNPEHRAVRPLTDLLTSTFGPQYVIAEEFADLPGAEMVLVFGSWAARHEGVPGDPPADVDVLVVGNASRSAVYEAADRAQQRLGLQVNPVLASEKRWSERSDALIQQIRSSPTLVLIRHDDEGEQES